MRMHRAQMYVIINAEVRVPCLKEGAWKMKGGLNKQSRLNVIAYLIVSQMADSQHYNITDFYVIN